MIKFQHKKKTKYIDSSDNPFKYGPIYEYTGGYTELFGSSDMKNVIKGMEKGDVYQIVYHLEGKWIVWEGSEPQRK